MKFRLLSCLLLALLSVGLSAQEGLSLWYAKSALAGPYAAVRPELALILETAEKGGIPAELMMARLTEGAEKRVSPERLVLALRRDLESYALVRDAITGSLGDVSPKDMLGLLTMGGMALRSGMEAAVFDDVLRGAVSRGVSPRRAAAALVGVAALDSRFFLDNETERSLALSLSLSKEGEDHFSSLSSLFLRGKAGKLGTLDMVGLAIRAFNSGGGFLELENQILRRLK